MITLYWPTVNKWPVMVNIFSQHLLLQLWLVLWSQSLPSSNQPAKPTLGFRNDEDSNLQAGVNAIWMMEFNRRRCVEKDLWLVCPFIVVKFLYYYVFLKCCLKRRYACRCGTVLKRSAVSSSSTEVWKPNKDKLPRFGLSFQHPYSFHFLRCFPLCLPPFVQVFHSPYFLGHKMQKKSLTCF